DVLPSLWFRNRWSWEERAQKPSITMLAGGDRIQIEDADLGSWLLAWTTGAQPLFCDNETNTAKLYGTPGPPYPKDSIADHVMGVAGSSVNPEQRGTKAALHYRLDVA